MDEIRVCLKINKSCIRKCFRFENEKQVTYIYIYETLK